MPIIMNAYEFKVIFSIFIISENKQRITVLIHQVHQIPRMRTDLYLCCINKDILHTVNQYADPQFTKKSQFFLLNPLDKLAKGNYNIAS